MFKLPVYFEKLVMSKILFCVIAFTIFFLTNTQTSIAQKLYEVCGNPQDSCRSSFEFDANDLAFRVTKKLQMWDEVKSVSFYAVILKSKKAFYDTDPMRESSCEKGFFRKSEINEAQKMFSDNKVFISFFGCYGDPDIYYTNTNQKFNFLAVYAGKTQKEANNFLQTVKASKTFAGANVRKMQVILCYGCH